MKNVNINILYGKKNNGSLSNSVGNNKFDK